MKRPLVAVAATMAAVVLLAAIAAAITWPSRDDDVRRHHAVVGVHGGLVRTELAYLTGMVAHHREAVDAAGELARSGRPAMRAFGRDIVATQTAQIVQMRAWLADWYAGRSADVGYQPMMRDLSGLSGDRLDRVFLQDMIGHHMAAVMMSQQLLVHGPTDHDQVGDLARTIRDEQHAEIFWMQDRLADWFDSGWSHGRGGMRPAMMG